MKSRKFILTGVLVGGSIFLAACGAKVNLSEYNQAELDSKVANHEIPDYVLNKRKPKIAVLPMSVSEEAVRGCGTNKTAQESFMDILVKARTVDVVERGQIDALMKEVKFSMGIGGDVDVSKLSDLGSGIDYVIVGSINSAKTAAKFREGGVIKDKKGNTTYVPPQCNEVAEVKMVARILKYPSGNIVKSISLEGGKNISRDVRNSYECRVQDPCSLINEATQRAVDDALEDIKAAFPSYGYVYKTMTHKENRKRIAFISLGTEDGIKSGDKVDIIEFVQEKDPVKNTTITREKVVAECTVVDVELGPDKSICLIQDEKVGAVFTKHAVKTKVNVGFGRMLEKGLRKIDYKLGI